MLDPIGRDEARDMARRELDKQIYQRDKPSWLERMWDRFSEWLQNLFSHAAQPKAHGNGGGWVSIVVIVVIALVAVALVVWLMWDRRNPRSKKDPLLEDKPSSALDHRDAAERLAAEGQWAEAIRERLRAIARDLEERAVLAPRPGRTADELAAEAGEAVPELADALRAGVRIFDDVWYGDRPGTAERYAQVKELDERLRAARPKPLEPDGPTPAGVGADDADGGQRW
ncbi:DUF4129 domain-containing protein [Actinomadura verrucosospora]|uniref:Protein-glutamine gamma-glutamyltransferase-like C-terminal domain-containing protein n=1 Tax=Actinomadura verrucosospora TaxID=46165 RepID=A0A7D3VXM4_ACTVE|nr:DUF4129 domain-containing protein [Actinomadura verrucosospora]QKG25158.1 hypothetical protein ACTIVE_6809 [Actinomadura verrucosospora]